MNNLVPILGFILSGLVLIIYPFIFIAGIMSLAGFGGGDFGFDTFIAISFLSLSMLYPITYIISLIIYLIRKNVSKRSKLLIISAPYIHLFLSVVFFIIWMSID